MDIWTQDLIADYLIIRARKVKSGLDVLVVGKNSNLSMHSDARHYTYKTTIKKMPYSSWNMKAVLLSSSKWCSLMEIYHQIDGNLSKSDYFTSTKHISELKHHITGLYRKSKFSEQQRFPNETMVQLNENNLQDKLRIFQKSNATGSEFQQIVFNVKSEIETGRAVYDRSRFEEECGLHWLENPVEALSKKNKSRPKSFPSDLK